MSGRASRGRRLAAWALAVVALAAGAYGTTAFAAAGGGGKEDRGAGPSATGAAAAAGDPASAAASRGDPAAGRQLFLAACASCHGRDARGIANRAPTLYGAGAQAADFYLRTGRMPLSEPDDVPVRAPVQYSEREIEDLVAYVASLGGPPIPHVDPAAGTLARGRQVFLDNCAGCHQIVGRGGIVTGAIAPPLQEASATEIAEAVRVGPYLMPPFSDRQIDQADLNALTRYVLWTRDTPNEGGWGIGELGPIPEGMVAWLIAIAALLGVARLIGERTP